MDLGVGTGLSQHKVLTVRKRGDLSWIGNTCRKKPDMEAGGCTARAEEAEAGGFLGSQSTRIRVPGSAGDGLKR